MAVLTFLLALSVFLQDNVECVSQCVSKYPPYYRGYYMKAMDCPGATLRNSSLTDIVCCIFDTALVPSIPQHINVSRDAYLTMVGDTTRTRALYPFYMQALSTAQITSKQEIAAFTAQILYETSGMNFSEENSNGEKYKGVESLGNFANGGADDTRRFINRGFLPLIGRHMYDLASSSVNNKIIRQPEMVALPSIGFQVAAWLWRNGYSTADNSSLPTGNLGMYFNGSEYSFLQLSYKIQLSTTGIEKLFQYWRHTVEVLGLPCPPQGKGPVCLSGKRKGLCKLMTSCKGEYTTVGCPGPSPIACCLDCRNPIDLAFVLDSSGSVTEANFRLGLEFIIRVCEYFDIGYPHGTRVSLIRYSTDATVIFRFNTYINKPDIFNAIRTIPYQAGITRTDLALSMAYNALFGNPNNGVRPKELGVPRILVLLTDGKSASGPSSLIEPSTLLRQEGVNIFVIGIGQSINKNELNIIASDPDADHVVCPKTFAEVNNMVERMREASCYEPALLDEDNEVISSVQQNVIKYYKYDLQNKTGIKTLFIETTGGRGDISFSMEDTNPRNYRFNLGSCGSRTGYKLSTSGRVVTLKGLESIDFCNVHKDGGCTGPRVVSKEEFLAEGIVIYMRRCSSRWFYVSIEGINKTNTFNMTLFKDFIRTEKIQNITEKSGSEKKTATFPIPQNVYIGVAVATIGTTATVASVVTLSCAKEFQVKGSTKIKKKKRAKNKSEAINNNAEINKGFERDDDVKPISYKNRSTSLAPLVEKYEHMSTGGPSRNAMDREKKLLQKEKVRSINVAEMEISNVKKSRTSSGSAENRKRKTSIQTVTLANTNQSEPPPPRHEISLVSSMIHDLQREDTIIQKTVKSVAQGSGEGNSCVEQSRIQRQITSTSVSVSIIKPPQDESDEKTACCFQWKPSLSTNKVKKSTKTEEGPMKFELEKNETEVENDDKAKKVSFLKRVKRKLTWRNALAVLCPCFSYYILEKGNAKKPLENEKEESEKQHREIRDRRFERDMQMSQAFCVLLSQLLFLAGVDARDNKIACAVVAIAMNYLSLVTLGWLIVQALYLFSFTRRRESEAKQKLKTNLYYAGAWGLPLFAVVILASKYDSYNKHPHCWISFSDSLSWSVATPMITLGLAQIILVILLVKALVTYRKSGNADENEDKKNVIKSGLRTVVCITITVIVTWLLGSLSLNIDRDVYHMFFTIFNALQGIAFFLFYVVLNPQVRQLLLAAWEWKESSATPFDEHEAIEVEEDKEKDKKKDKGKSKAANDKKSQDRKPEDLCIVNTVQNVAEARMAAASTVKNSKGKNKENVTLVKFGEKKETEKASLASKPSGSVPAKKLLPITQQKNKTPSNKSRGKTGLPYTAKATVRKTNDFPSSPKGNQLRSPSPRGHQSQDLLYQNKNTEQFELKDNVPVAAFSSPLNHNVRPTTPLRKLQPITPEPSKSPKLKPKNHKQAGKNNIAKGNKT